MVEKELRGATDAATVDDEARPRRRGTRPRGSRTAITVRVPDDQYEQVLRDADALGIPIGSWAAIQLAASKGLEIPDYINEEIRKAAAGVKPKRTHTQRSCPCFGRRETNGAPAGRNLRGPEECTLEVRQDLE